MADNPPVTPAPVSDSLGNTINPAQEDGNLATLAQLNALSIRMQELQLLRTESIELATILAQEKLGSYTFKEVR